jgi:phosphoribosylaminoimidazole-succinocarboxamide synthase
MKTTILQTDLQGIPLRGRGKVRDMYDVEGNLLIVATDRLSAFDYVLPNGIPGKGALLTQLSRFWFEKMASMVGNHLITVDADQFPAVLQPHVETLRWRSMLVRSLDMFPVECVARGYLVGSGWKDYQQTGAVCGIQLPEGLELCSRLPEPIFTPATKATDGHDENISFDAMVKILGGETAEQLRRLTLEIYSAACRHAESHGIILADTKFEFGRGADGEIVLADEVLTPDSSRFWPADDYRPGRNQPSFDKQFVRDFLEAEGWDKQPPVPTLPDEIVAGTADRYREIYRLLTGHSLPDGAV